MKTLLNVYETKQIEKQLYLENRIKYTNEHVYYSIDAIFNAISAQKKVAFKYFDMDMDKEVKYRKGGEEYVFRFCRKDKN